MKDSSLQFVKNIPVIQFRIKFIMIIENYRHESKRLEKIWFPLY